GKTYYVFTVPSISGDAGGYMPLNRQFGFVENSGNMEHAMAHELGHGAFNLWHTFSDRDFVAAQGATDNLMDYSGGTRLYRHQWDLLHNPEAVLMPGMVDEEETMMIFDPNYEIAADLLVEYLKALGAKPIVTKTEKSIRVESVLSFAAIVLNIDYTFKEDGDLEEYSSFLMKMGVEFYDAMGVQQTGVIDKINWKIKKWDAGFKDKYREKPPRAVAYVVDMMMSYPYGIGPGTLISLYKGEHFSGKSFELQNALINVFISRVGLVIGGKGVMGEVAGGAINAAYEEILNFHKDVKEVNNMPFDVKHLAMYYIPSLFPVQYQDFFHAAGINPLNLIISIDAATFLKGDYGISKLQQAAAGMDTQWKDFVTANPRATQEDILVFINSLIRKNVQTAFFNIQIEGLNIYMAR
ncbi:MAG: hypothetical protein LBV47_02400, partial [Bacteroidales bacterium]|nr:hypothetical protein [Bacteroidales bacterium]